MGSAVVFLLKKTIEINQFRDGCIAFSLIKIIVDEKINQCRLEGYTLSSYGGSLSFWH